jgi:predicted  nucleic acid-binding Zn-ribbon protein
MDIFFQVLTLIALGAIMKNMNCMKTEFRRDLTELRRDLTKLKGDLTELRRDLTEFKENVKNQFSRITERYRRHSFGTKAGQ